MRTFTLILLIPACCYAAITGVKATGTTATQAVLAYLAPSPAACTLEVSTSASYAPVVYDVDESKFSGSSLDSRPGNVSLGRSRVFVVGKRWADIGASGKRYSRALQTNTLHYFRITCGSDTATGTFLTANIPFGATYPDTRPVDRASPGQYAWPTLDDTPRALRPGYVANETHIDPQTGLKLGRVQLPGDLAPGTTVYGFTSGSTCREIDGGSDWTTPQNACANTGGQYASISSANDKLLLRKNSYAPGVFFYSAQVRVTGYGDSATASDRTLGICMSADHVNCSTLSRTLVLNQSSETTVSTPASPTSLDTDWPALNYFVQPFSYYYLTTATGMVNTTEDAGGSTITWSSGTKFPDSVSVGTGIFVGGIEYPVVSVADGNTVKIGANLGTQSGVAYTLPAFSVLVWKTTDAGTVFLRGVSITAQYQSEISWPETGQGYMCHPLKTTDTEGKSGRLCQISDRLYWIGDDGEVRYLSRLLSGGGGEGGKVYWGGSTGCGTNYAIWDESDAWSWYCSFSGGTGSTLAKMTLNYPSLAAVAPSGYFANCATNGNSPPCWNYTFLASAFRTPPDNESVRIHAFDSAFDNTKFGCGPAIALTHYLVVYCLMGAQDSAGWTAIWDLNIDPAVANPIVAAAPDYGPGCQHWCTDHATWGPVGQGTLLAMSVQRAGGSDPGKGPYDSFYVSGDLSANLAACPSNGIDAGAAGQSKCSVIVVDGEPCKVGHAGPETANCPTAGRSNDFWLQDALPGDIFWVRDNQGHGIGYSELVRLLVKNGNAWTFERGYGGTAVTNFSTSTGLKFTAECTLWYTKTGFTGSGWWWDFVHDPHGTALVVDPGPIGHASYSANVTEGGTGTGAGCGGQGAGWQLIHRARKLSDLAGLSTSYCYNGSPPFAGKAGEGNENAVEDYVSAQNGSTWLDGRPMFQKASPVANGQGTPLSLVSGSLYKGIPPDGSLPFTSVLKQLPAAAFCGPYPMVDVSGPASTITGNAADHFKYCAAFKSGECYAGSAAGEVYANCPRATKGRCADYNLDRDICIVVPAAGSGVISQYDFSAPTHDGYGRFRRTLTTGFQPYRRFLGWWNARYTSSADNQLVTVGWGGNDVQDYLAFLGTIPPVGKQDSVARNTFVPTYVKLTPPAGLGANNAVVEFGYAENGSAGNFYCTSRQETCVAVSDTVNEANPFYWATESFSGTPCAGGCTIAVPGISGRVVYYRWKFRDASNNVIATSALQVAAVP